MRVISLHQAYMMANADFGDTEIERDIKFDQFFRHYRYRMADSVTHEILAECRQENLDFLITKD